MLLEIPLIVQSLDKISPDTDQRWVPDGENVWFLPFILDVNNDTYCGYWYGTKKYSESLHYHTGISQGYVFCGEFLMICDKQTFSIKKHKGFVLPPDVPHTAELIPDAGSFLYFGTVIGKAIYENKEVLDVKSYLDDIKKHYKKHGLEFSSLVINY